MTECVLARIEGRLDIEREWKIKLIKRLIFLSDHYNRLDNYIFERVFLFVLP